MKTGRRTARNISIILLALGIAAVVAIFFNRLETIIPVTKAGANLRSICISLATYRDHYDSYPPNLSDLGPASPGQPVGPVGAALIDPVLAKGEKSGFRYSYRAIATQVGGKFDAYKINKDPIADATKGRHYFTDDCKVLHAEDRAPATSKSRPIEWQSQ